MKRGTSKIIGSKINVESASSEQGVIAVVIATGISSVVAQLLIIREFLSQFQGNEIVIALILFNWLILGGLGTMVARTVSAGLRTPTRTVLGWCSFALCGLPALQIFAIRALRDVFFIHGSSVGFYPTFFYTFLTMAPYALLVGFVLPYSLFVLRNNTKDYPGARIYITDNIGDICGGALFSFVLVHFLTPLQAIFCANIPLIVASYILVSIKGSRQKWLGASAAVLILVGGLVFEKPSLAPAGGKLSHYRESRYGRITVHRHLDQYTLFQNGLPVGSSQNRSIAEETIHYPLAQLERPQQVLLISSASGAMQELRKYGLQHIDYVELDPEVSRVQFQFGLTKKIPGMKVINQDGRVYLSKTERVYDAIIVNLPEPETFQINRFYTERFFKLARQHLAPDGVFSFAMQGFDNYLAEPQRRKLSSLYNTACSQFKNVILLPGQKVYFICSNAPLTVDIPQELKRKMIPTIYISRYFHGNLTRERIKRLNELMDTTIPKNHDTAPYLMRVIFSQWFAKFQTSPIIFIVIICGLAAFYLFRISRVEFVLFTTGCMTMGTEIIVIFAFQIFFGYIYLQIGIIITVFLAGLLPGAWLADRLNRQSRQLLMLMDGFLILILIVFIAAVYFIAADLPSIFFLSSGFAVSLAGGFQFPVALNLCGGNNAAATRTFSADLIGAAWGSLFTSVVLIPYLGIIGAAAGLICLKFICLIVIGTGHEKTVPTTISLQ